jgi:hypothetical protein
MAAMSRLLGGYHVRIDNEEGLVLGRKIAMYSWPKYLAYFDGTGGRSAVVGGLDSSRALATCRSCARIQQSSFLE